MQTLGIIGSNKAKFIIDLSIMKQDPNNRKSGL